MLVHQSFPAADLTLMDVKGLADLRLGEEGTGLVGTFQLAHEEGEPPALKGVACSPNDGPRALKGKQVVVVFEGGDRDLCVFVGFAPGTEDECETERGRSSKEKAKEATEEGSQQGEEGQSIESVQTGCPAAHAVRMGQRPSRDQYLGHRQQQQEPTERGGLCPASGIEQEADQRAARQHARQEGKPAPSRHPPTAYLVPIPMLVERAKGWQAARWREGGRMTGSHQQAEDEPKGECWWQARDDWADPQIRATIHGDRS